MLFNVCSRHFVRATCTPIRTSRHTFISISSLSKAPSLASPRRPFSCQARSTPSPASEHVKEFLQSARDGKATISDAAQLLQRSQDDIKSRAQSLDQQRKEASAVGAAHILKWLLQLPPQKWEDDIDHAFVEPFCWHIEAEGHSKFLIDWLDVWCRDDSICQYVQPRGEAKHPYYVWSSIMLAEILKAKVRLDEASRADEAIQILSNFPRRKDIPLFHGPAFVALKKLIESNKARLSVAAYNTFASMFPWNFKGDRLKFELAQLALFHPTEPNPMALLELPTDLNSEKKIASTKARFHLSVIWLRVAYTLRLQGDPKNAAHAEARSRQFTSSVWNNRRRIWAREFRLEPQLTTLHESSPHVDTFWTEAETHQNGNHFRRAFSHGPESPTESKCEQA